MNDLNQQTETLALMFATSMGILLSVIVIQQITDFFKKRKAKKKKK